MTPKENPSANDKALHTLEEICENTRAIRRVVNRILDQLQESQEADENDHYDSDALAWDDLNNHDDMYY